MHAEQPECRYCGGCRDENKNYTVLDFQDGKWLEEMGSLFAASVEGMKKVPSYSAFCHEKLATNRNLYSCP